MKYLYLPCLIAVLAGCKVGPNYTPPNTTLPASYTHSATNNASTTNSPALEQWWGAFQDENLNVLIRHAKISNHDIRIAQARVREARALRGITDSLLAPQISAQGGYSRSRISEHTLNGRQLSASGQPLVNDLFDGEFDMSWEIDVFGGKRREIEAAQADLEASDENYNGTMVSVLAEVGLSYIDLRASQRQLAVARDNLHAQEQTLLLTKDLSQAGLVSDLDAARAEAHVATTRAQIPPLEEAQQRAIHRLSVLVGKSPDELSEALSQPKNMAVATPRVPLGLPSDLLRQRPDIRQAERQLGAATARIGVAKADYLPRFYLTGAAGLQSIESSDFFDSGSRFWSLGPSLRWPIFTAGRIKQNIAVHNARQEQAALRYEKTVLTALEEVENALTAYGQEQERWEALITAEAASTRAATMAHDRYRGGLVNFLDVLEAERTRLATQDNVVRSEHRLNQNLVRLYKSLGGGWHMGETTAPQLSAK